MLKARTIRQALPGLLVLLLLWGLMSCATQGAASGLKPAAGKGDLDRFGARAPGLFWPLNLGNSWTYTRSFLGETGNLTVTVLQRDEEGYFLDSAGGKIMVTPFGVRDTQRYLLQAPLEKGRRWRAQIAENVAEHFEITEDDATVSVPAGRFEHCVVVRSMTYFPAGAHMIVLSAYAPKVGLVRSETKLVNNQRREASQVTLELSKYVLP